jgi:hypothetical protein
LYNVILENLIGRGFDAAAYTEVEHNFVGELDSTVRQVQMNATG